MMEQKKLTMTPDKTSDSSDLKKVDKVKKKKNYFPPDLIMKAIQALEKGASYRKVSKEFQIPVSTLFKKSKCTPEMIKCKQGSPTVLTKEEELELVSWIEQRVIDGFPATKKELMDTAEIFVKNLNRKNPFKEGRPGNHWFEGFIRRHPNISFESMEKINLETPNEILQVDGFHENLLDLVEMNKVNEPVEVDPIETETMEYIETKPEVFIEAKEFEEKEVEAVKFDKTSEVNPEFLEIFENNLPEEMLEQFQNHDKYKPWTGAIEMKGLYLYWLRIKNILEKINIDKELQQMFYESSKKS